MMVVLLDPVTAVNPRPLAASTELVLAALGALPTSDVHINRKRGSMRLKINGHNYLIRGLTRKAKGKVQRNAIAGIANALDPDAIGLANRYALCFAVADTAGLQLYQEFCTSPEHETVEERVARRMAVIELAWK